MSPKRKLINRALKSLAPTASHQHALNIIYHLCTCPTYDNTSVCLGWRDMVRIAVNELRLTHPHELLLALKRCAFVLRIDDQRILGWYILECCKLVDVPVLFDGWLRRLMGLQFAQKVTKRVHELCDIEQAKQGEYFLGYIERLESYQREFWKLFDAWVRKRVASSLSALYSAAVCYYSYALQQSFEYDRASEWEKLCTFFCYLRNLTPR
jgi:hypothetical protein